MKSYLWCRYYRILMRSLLHHHPVGRHFVVSQIFEKLQITGLLITLMVYLCFQSFSFNCRSFGSCMKFVGLLTVLVGLPKFCSSYTQFFLAVLTCYPSSIEPCGLLSLTSSFPGNRSFGWFWFWKLSKSLPVGGAGIHKGSNLGSIFFVSYIIDTLLILSMLMILIRTLSVIGLLTCGNS